MGSGRREALRRVADPLRRSRRRRIGNAGSSLWIIFLFDTRKRYFIKILLFRYVRVEKRILFSIFLRAAKLSAGGVDVRAETTADGGADSLSL